MYFIGGVEQIKILEDILKEEIRKQGIRISSIDDKKLYPDDVVDGRACRRERRAKERTNKRKYGYK